MLIQLYILSLVLSAVLLMAALLLGDRADDAVPDRTARLRFWTFFVAFFGLAGLFLDGLDILRATSALPVAFAVGLFAAFGSRWAARRTLE
ncbi:MAG: hypothetical protein AAGF92_10435 [Myxococcota bacterium]